MDRILQILNNHCEHWRKVIPMLQSGEMQTRVGGEDTTEQTIELYLTLLGDTEALIAKIEGDL